MTHLNNNFKIQMHEIMTQAWSFVKQNGFSMSEALQMSWRNFKLRAALTSRIVKFYFQKINGEIREAYGTLKEGLVPEVGESNRKKNDTVQTYYDTEKAEWRCFKKANLLRIA